MGKTLPGKVEWLRPEFRGREEELETRADFESRTGTTAQSLSSHFTRYANRVPKFAARFGKQKWFVQAELDDFLTWIRENSGTRSEAEIKEAEIARLDVALEETEERIARHKEALAKAERDKARFAKQRKRAVDDMKFLKQGS
jgi:predicted RNase H-like nuclease (RuvC/YqgF family)